MPEHALGKWALNDRGYPRFYSGKYRNRYVHRVVWSLAARRDVLYGHSIHHQNFNKLCFCLENLVELPQSFNVSGALRCPYTGAFLGREEWRRRFGE